MDDGKRTAEGGRREREGDYQEPQSESRVQCPVLHIAKDLAGI